jgi:hypothetical protein
MDRPSKSASFERRMSFRHPQSACPKHTSVTEVVRAVPRPRHCSKSPSHTFVIVSGYSLARIILRTHGTSGGGGGLARKASPRPLPMYPVTKPNDTFFIALGFESENGNPSKGR